MIKTALQKLHLKNFRCFTSETIDFDGPLVLIEGINGSGKTSLLEALHYTCYLRSFRTHLPRDLIKFGTEGFFIQATFANHTIHVGCTGTKKHIKINQKPISSYKELREHFKIITVTEDDVEIVKESPEKRRTFIDHALLLEKPELITLFKNYKIHLKNRNALLQRHSINTEELIIWTKKIWELSQLIQKERTNYLTSLETSAHQFILENWDNPCSINFTYQPKKIDAHQSWNDFEIIWKAQIMLREKQFKRTLFGAHLDDFLLFFNNKPAKLYSSRGQQKLIIFMLKMAQVKQLISEQGSAVTFLLDDFMTDFDTEVAQKVIKTCLSLNIQLIFTSPINNSLEKKLLSNYKLHVVNI
ncbi:DNA replication and repair protein RecF [Candidatus Babeliales bacterium]|nr:DNA replication and repair protein RecF [Candidatus Babeliales bacterium]